MWQADISPGDGEHRVGVRIKGTLVAVRYTG